MYINLSTNKLLASSQVKVLVVKISNENMTLNALMSEVNCIKKVSFFFVSRFVKNLFKITPSIEVLSFSVPFQTFQPFRLTHSV